MRTAEEIRAALARDAKIFEGSTPLSRGHKGAIVGALNKHLGGDVVRKWCLGWLFGKEPVYKPLSTKKRGEDQPGLTEGEWLALDKWIGAMEVSGKWEVDPDFPPEATVVLTKSVMVYSQVEAWAPAEAGLSPTDLLVQGVGYLGGVVTQTFDARGVPDAPPALVPYSTLEEFLGDDESEIF